MAVLWSAPEAIEKKVFSLNSIWDLRSFRCLVEYLTDLGHPPAWNNCNLKLLTHSVLFHHLWMKYSLWNYDLLRSSAISQTFGASVWQCGKSWALLINHTRGWPRQRWQMAVWWSNTVKVLQNFNPEIADKQLHDRASNCYSNIQILKIFRYLNTLISKGEGEVEDRQLHDGASDKLPSSQQEELDCCLSGGQYLNVFDFDADDKDDDAGPKWSGLEAGFNMWSMSHAAQTRH